MFVEIRQINDAERVLIAVPPIEAWVDKQKKEYRLSIAVPGMDQKDLQVTLCKGTTSR